MMIRKIEIGGEDRTVCFNFNCLEELCEIGGYDVLNGLSVHGNFKLGTLLAFTGLKYGIDPEGRIEDKDLPFDMKKVGSWLSPAKMEEVIEAFNSQCQTGKKKQEKMETQSHGTTSGE
jgi:hypothetical protein